LRLREVLLPPPYPCGVLRRDFQEQLQVLRLRLRLRDRVRSFELRVRLCGPGRRAQGCSGSGPQGPPSGSVARRSEGHRHSEE
jgi:hypothetical protein